MITVNKQIQQVINQMKETGIGTIEYKWFEIKLENNNWSDQYNISVKDTSSNNYIYESHIYCKNDVMLYKNIEMILEYLG